MEINLAADMDRKGKGFFDEPSVEADNTRKYLG